ncbi:MAG: ribokinase [Streptosporangiaceae bacterium]|jgi:ribokinase
MAKRPQLTVLGSLNMDISVTVPRLPAPGATVLGTAAMFTPGGKGANQAVAAARLGAVVRMVGCVGDDDFGRQLRAALDAEGVDAATVRVADGAATGLAMISVDQAGENLITVAPGANREVGAADAATAVAGPPDVLVISAEIPVAAIRAALDQAGQTRCVLNLAPAPPEAAALVTAGVDWLVVNESEAASVLGRDVRGLEEASLAAAELVAAGARHAVITAGAHGVVLAVPGRDPLTIEAFEVQAVDTVGAGDCFVGALAVALAAKVPDAEAVRAAAAAGAAAATRSGAQAGMPRPADVLDVTGLTWPVGVNHTTARSRSAPP